LSGILARNMLPYNTKFLVLRISFLKYICFSIIGTMSLNVFGMTGPVHMLSPEIPGGLEVVQEIVCCNYAG
jgi:hypothetical protein